MKRDLRKLSPVVVDVTLALMLAAVELFNLFRHVGLERCECGFNVPGSIALISAATLPLILRRRFPFESGFVIGGALFLAPILEVPTLGFGGLVAIYTIAELGSPLQRKIALGFVIVAVVANPMVEGDFEALPEDVLSFGSAWILGSLIRTRRAYTEELEQRAEQLERERDTQARLAVADERSRIARELHDVVTHGVGVMVVQTEGARSVLRSDPEAADTALERVLSTGRESLAEMRKLLGVLRSEQEAAQLAPQPGMDRFDDLVEQVRGAGLDVDVVEEGDRITLPATVDISAFRIVQESLTNVLKHAHARSAKVRLHWTDDTLDIEITDDGTGAPVEGGDGHGLAGMRERVALVGGSFTAGPKAGHGFTVTASLPVVTS